MKSVIATNKSSSTADEDSPQSTQSSNKRTLNESNIIEKEEEQEKNPFKKAKEHEVKNPKISWGKHHPYNNIRIPLVKPNTKPIYTKESPALCLQIHAQCKRARSSTLHLPHGPVELPTFMPVGTKGSLKGMTAEEIQAVHKIKLMLHNTYHLAIQPGTKLIKELHNTSHSFSNYNANLLTDSGGFQMVSLLKFANITEEGVQFRDPQTNAELLLKPEDSMEHQNNIGADIIMALDDVVSSTNTNYARFEEATHRTIRWLDRCFEAHKFPEKQNLFPIVQGGLDFNLRSVCLEAFQERDKNIPGYAIGGLSGGEEKQQFIQIVDFCCKALPDLKPRYLMGVGYPLDIVVCTALGVDMYDCVYPTRTARFGAALVNDVHPGTLRLKTAIFRNDYRPIASHCYCQACKYYTRSQIHFMLKGLNESLGVQLMTHHNLAYMMTLMQQIREAIRNNIYKQFVHDFLKVMFPDTTNKGEDYIGEHVPEWVLIALRAADMPLQ